jgi:hypothetical protein
MDWNSALAAMDETVAGVFDLDACTAKARKAGVSVNGSASADGARADFDFMGTFELSPPQQTIARHMPIDPGINRDIEAYDALVSAQTSGFAWALQRGDWIVVAAGTFVVAAKAEDGTARMAFYCNKVKA